MKLEIDLPDEMIRSAVESAAHDVILPGQSHFIEPRKTSFNDDLRRRVREHVEGLALAELICEISRKILTAEVRDVLTTTIRAEVKKQVRQLRQQGELFGENEP